MLSKSWDYLCNNPSKSLDIFNNILENHSKNIDALNGKGIALIKLNRYDEAESVFQESLNIKETSSAYLNLGIINKNNGNYQDALLNYNNALNINSNLENIIKILKNEIQAYIEKQERYELLDHYPNEIKHLIEKGYEYQTQEKYWDALNCYEHAIKEETSTKEIVGDYITDIKLVLQKEFLLRHPRFDDFYINHLKKQSINDLLFEENQTSALQNINKALEINSNDLDALNIKGTILFYFDEYEDSLYCFDKCLNLDSSYIYALFNKSLVLRRINKLSSARKCLENISKLGYSYMRTELYHENILERLSNILDIPIENPII